MARTDYSAPQISSQRIPAAARAALAGDPTHFEWQEREAFGRPYYVLLVWLLGAYRPLRWDAKATNVATGTKGKWVTDNR